MNGNKSHNPNEGGLQSPELNSFEKLTVAKLKAFLRSNDLKTTGVKAELVDRAKDFLSMKRLSAGGSDSSTAHTKAMQIIYPEASFCIPCKGDVCKGDEVLFVQEVFDDFKPQSRKGEHIGHRQVAGRIINESYGALKQQHTFTIEVLWSAGTQPKQPLSTMLIKGRNLYKLSVRRRSWQNESLRLAVLNEKHERGQEARMLRTGRSKKGIKRKNRDNVRLLPCIRPPAGNSLYNNDGTANNVNNVLTCFVDLVDLTREEDEKSGEVVGMKNGNSAAAAGLIICLQQPLQLINNMAVRMPHAAKRIASEGGRTCISAGF
ncbi:hypothetical protein CEUSTIGMA_g11341.t1 [Chlamydomonas eustigma]|uniref:SAP domain-containing protein n=1 Tax=Chlamydomonas eustigma TaxID=1157962 RepID=A0A250XLH5_9CHLO|nr:hypothetical protein CEUSTIGMA_g11341.t1 [Chlamydomonas eustigma]|eukprot:GAX83917.1 hypothetical protein CEUSTIGMA_g11341.t1 [Chlamydomonas eustigma]